MRLSACSRSGVLSCETLDVPGGVLLSVLGGVFLAKTFCLLKQSLSLKISLDAGFVGTWLD